jgi:glycosyltransferase involved in cell wall biosynthesis
MFVHMRCLEMLQLNIDVRVYVASKMNDSYTYQGVKVQLMTSAEIVNQLDEQAAIYLHLLNIHPFSKDDGWPIYKHIMKHNLPSLMYVHGSEVQKYTARWYEFNYRISDVLIWIKKDCFVIPKMKQFFRIQKRTYPFVFPSLWMKEETERNLKLTIDDYKIIPNGIDTSFFEFHNLTENRFKILTIRSLSKKVYDIEKTIEVLENLPEKYTLDIYGEGIYKEQYQKLIASKKLENRVQIISRFLERSEMKALFLNYGAFISTTRMDSQGVTMMEAAASGLLVVTTDNSSKQEFIHDAVNGVLGNSAKKIAAKIVAITNNKSRFEEVVVKGRKSMEVIDISTTIRKEMELLKQYL